jgi:hypothetical protein
VSSSGTSTRRGGEGVEGGLDGVGLGGGLLGRTVANAACDAGGWAALGPDPERVGVALGVGSQAARVNARAISLARRAVCPSSIVPV